MDATGEGRATGLDAEELEMEYAEALEKLRWLARRCRETGDARAGDLQAVAYRLRQAWGEVR